MGGSLGWIEKSHFCNRELVKKMINFNYFFENQFPPSVLGTGGIDFQKNNIIEIDHFLY